MIPTRRPASELPAPPRVIAPRGDTIIEALVATTLLTVGVLALVSLSVVMARDERRLAARRRAATVLAQRASEWTSGPCTDATGGRLVDGLQERWRVARAPDSLEVLIDSVAMPADAATSEVVDHVAARGCAP